MSENFVKNENTFHFRILISVTVDILIFIVNFTFRSENIESPRKLHLAFKYWGF